MKISVASALVVALVVLSGPSTTTRAQLGLGGILGGLTNLTAPLLGNLGGGALSNLTTGVVGGLAPTLSNVTGSVLNLTTIVGTVNNITGPLLGALANFTGPVSNLSVSTNITVTVTLNLPPTTASGILSSFPNSLTIAPLGLTEVAFTVYTVQGGNASAAVPVTIALPVLSYLNFPVSGSAAVTVDFPLGSTLSVVGITNTITRLFFGVSWQTFPQLTSVVISKLLPGSLQSDPIYTLDIPALMCKP